MKPERSVSDSWAAARRRVSDLPGLFTQGRPVAPTRNCSAEQSSVFRAPSARGPSAAGDCQVARAIGQPIAPPIIRRRRRSFGGTSTALPMTCVSTCRAGLHAARERSSAITHAPPERRPRGQRYREPRGRRRRRLARHRASRHGRAPLSHLGGYACVAREQRHHTRPSRAPTSWPALPRTTRPATSPASASSR